MATPAEIDIVKKTLSNIPGLVIRSSTGTKFIVESSGDRSELKKKVESDFSKKGMRFDSKLVSGSSFPATVLTQYNLNILYKNAKGGMAETTLNSTITELVPCIAFLKNINEFDVEKMYAEVLKHNNSGLTCYLEGDSKAGMDFINKAEDSSKFKEKMRGAQGVLKFIRDQDRGKKITNVYWGYRRKPMGVMPSHPGDIFIKFEDSTLLGVSIKSGGASTQEPKLNTYVNPIMVWFGKQNDFENMKKEAYHRFYADIPEMPIDFSKQGSAQFYDALSKLETQDPQEYNRRYDEMLDYMRTKLIEVLSSDEKKTKKWLLEVVTGSQESVPLVVVKAVESSGDYQILEDDDIVKACVSRSRNTGGLKIQKSQSSKQDFTISLTCNAKTTDLNFSIRSNKVGVQHKLGQFLNLAVKFNGIKK